MYFEKTIERINNIPWADLVTHENSEGLRSIEYGRGKDHGYEFLRRLACFYTNQSITPRKPLMSNIASLLGDNRDCKVIDFCKDEIADIIRNNHNLRSFNFLAPLDYYLQLSNYSDSHPEVAKYLDVYEPLVQVAENGKMFILKLNEFWIVDCPEFYLSGWYEFYSKAESIQLKW